LWIKHVTDSPLTVLGASLALLMVYFSNLFWVDPAARQALFNWIANFRASAAK